MIITLIHENKTTQRREREKGHTLRYSFIIEPSSASRRKDSSNDSYMMQSKLNLDERFLSQFEESAFQPQSPIMRSVTLSELESIVERKEICILNMTRLSVHFVSSLVNHSPGNIATKQDSKQLPLELWREIIAWVEMDLKSSNYFLVQVQSLEEHGASRILSCAKIIERNRCGLLELEDDVDEYRKYLRCPGEGDDPKQEPKRVKTYDQHLRERFEELGYDWVPSYFWGLG
ncbi:hypothetical protein CEP53_011004 [Fusarium sp. AF-6]|nr:hypothetical protein CEP53_011004 [Fusarium sp. AF-6]